MRDVMLDLETFGSRPGSVIVSIGAVKMDLERGLVGEGFYRAIDPVTSQRLGLTLDASTVTWWLGQSEPARQAVCNPAAKVHLAEALRSFTDFIGTEATIWGNGADFDNVLLAAAYDAAGSVPPWKFWNNRCYRTMKSLFPDVKLERAGTHHNALDDAISQADHLVRIMKALRAAASARADLIEIDIDEAQLRTEVA